MPHSMGRSKLLDMTGSWHWQAQNVGSSPLGWPQESGSQFRTKCLLLSPPSLPFAPVSVLAQWSALYFTYLYMLYTSLYIFIRNCSKPQISSESGPPQRPELCKVLVEMSPSIRTGLNSFWSTSRSWRTDFSCGWRCHVMLVKWLGINISFVF